MKYRVCLMVFALVLGVSPARSQTHVLFTVDVESYAEGDPAKQIWGRVGQDGEHWGITRLMDIFEASGVRGTFYVNVYETAKYGVGPVRMAAREIHRRGHDLALHSHPHPMYPVHGLSQARLVHQTEILRQGIEMLRSWTGKTVIAHRAGGFRANADTLVAAQSLGLRVDSSYTAGSLRRYPDAEAGPPGNTVHVGHGIIRLPVTQYDQVRLGQWSSPRLVDLEGSTEAELKAVLDQAAEAGLCTVNVLMHSFSLSRNGVPDPAVAQRLRNVLAHVAAHPRLKAVTTSQLYDLIVAEDVCAGEAPFVPVTGPMLTYARALEDIEKGWKNALVVALPVFGLALLVGAIGLAAHRVYIHRRTRDLYSR